MRSTLALLFVFACLVASAQPFTESDLSWTGSHGPNSGTMACSVTASNSLMVTSENTSGTAWMIGSGPTFSILTSPTSGTLSGLNPSAGTVTYTPNANFVGSDLFTFQVQSASCTTNAVVYVNVIDSQSTNAVCTLVTNIVSIQNGTSGYCYTETTNGVSTGPPSCVTNNPLGGLNYFGTAPVSGTVCSYTTCSGLTDTNVVSFSFVTTAYSNATYQSWVICNPTGSAKNYQVDGLFSYQITTAGAISILVKTNGVVAAMAVNSLIGGSTTVVNTHFNPVFSVGPGVLNLPTTVYLYFSSSNAPASIASTFTNAFQ